MFIATHLKNTQAVHKTLQSLTNPRKQAHGDLWHVWRLSCPCRQNNSIRSPLLGYFLVSNFRGLHCFFPRLNLSPHPRKPRLCYPTPESNTKITEARWHAFDVRASGFSGRQHSRLAYVCPRLSLLSHFPGFPLFLPPPQTPVISRPRSQTILCLFSSHRTQVSLAILTGTDFGPCRGALDSTYACLLYTSPSPRD